MKPRIVLIIISLLIINSSLLISQNTWIQTYRPFQRQWWTDSYTVEDVIVTQDGGYVVSGGYELIGDAPWEYEKWGFLMKTDSDGNILWAVSDSVDFLVESENSAFVETIEGDLISVSYQFAGGGCIIKRDSNGLREWEVPITDFGVLSMSITIDGNIIFGGRAESNAALRKITPDGETLWTNIIEMDSSIAFSVTQSNDGGYLLAGKKYDDDDEDDILVIKTDSNGDSLWTRTFDGLGGNDQGNCIIETSNGNIVVVGEIHQRAIYTIIVKIASNGNTIWSNIYPELAACYSVLQSQDGNYVGYSWGGISTNSTQLFKIDNNQDFIWNNQLELVLAKGDRSFAELENGYFICSGRDDYRERIYLIKTDEEGNYTSISNNYISLSDFYMNCYPNPFNPSTIIEFSIQNNSEIELLIYNIKGQKIKILAKNEFSEGSHSIIWNGDDDSGNSVSSGIYFYRLNINGKTEAVRRCLLLK